MRSARRSATAAAGLTGGDAVFDRMAERFRSKVRAGEYVLPLHAEEEMDDDGLTLADVEHAILTGRITERQEDTATGELKYLICGRTATDQPAAVVAKLSLTGKVVIITVYAL
jgi:hypothetical protein